MAGANPLSARGDAAAPAAPVFDPKVLSDMFGQDRGVVAAVLETFVTSMTASVAELQAATDRQDLASMATLAHRIKGAAHMSGALALGLAAFALERCARAGEWGAARDSARQLEQQWLLVRDHPSLRP